jgi:hypothetical protein
VAGNDRRFFCRRRPDAATRRPRPCRFPVFHLYYQENTGADACKCAATGLFFCEIRPVSVSVYRLRAQGAQSEARRVNCSA